MGSICIYLIYDINKKRQVCSVQICENKIMYVFWQFWFHLGKSWRILCLTLSWYNSSQMWLQNTTLYQRSQVSFYPLIVLQFITFSNTKHTERKKWSMQAFIWVIPTILVCFNLDVLNVVFSLLLMDTQLNVLVKHDSLIIQFSLGGGNKLHYAA